MMIYSPSTGNNITCLGLTNRHVTLIQGQQLYSVQFLTHLSLASLLWDIGKQNSPRCDAEECGVPSGAILFVNFIEKLDKY